MTVVLHNSVNSSVISNPEIETNILKILVQCTSTIKPHHIVQSVSPKSK